MHLSLNLSSSTGFLQEVCFKQSYRFCLKSCYFSFKMLYLSICPSIPSAFIQEKQVPMFVLWVTRSCAGERTGFCSSLKSSQKGGGRFIVNFFATVPTQSPIHYQAVLASSLRVHFCLKSSESGFNTDLIVWGCVHVQIIFNVCGTFLKGILGQKQKSQ